jgi:hypothetical protein
MILGHWLFRDVIRSLGVRKFLLPLSKNEHGVSPNFGPIENK